MMFAVVGPGVESATCSECDSDFAGERDLTEAWRLLRAR